MRLKEIREARGITQRKAALGLNISPTVYNRYENGIREPSNAMMLLIADYFGVTVDELLGRKPEEANDGQPVAKTPEARTLAIGVDRMTKEDRDRVLKMVMLMFEHADYFEGNDDHEA